MLDSFYILHLNYYQAHLICFYGMLLSNRHTILHLKRPMFNHALSGDLEHCNLVTMTIRIHALKREKREGSQAPPNLLMYFCSHFSGPHWPPASAIGNILSALLCLESIIWSNLEPLSLFSQAISGSLHGTSSCPHTEWQLGWWPPWWRWNSWFQAWFSHSISCPRKVT